MNILIVDDDSSFARVLHTLLSKKLIRAEITYINNLPDALAYIEESYNIDVVFTDWNIPAGNEGAQVIQATTGKFPEAVIIAMTGNPYNRDAIRVHEPRFILNKAEIIEELGPIIAYLLTHQS